MIVVVQLEMRPRSAWRDVSAAVVVACLSLAAVWWSTRRSLAALDAPSDGIRACPAVYPAPPWCFPAWHVQVAVLVSLVVVAALAGAVVVIRRKGPVVPVTAVLVVIGLLAWLLAAQPTRYLPIW